MSRCSICRRALKSRRAFTTGPALHSEADRSTSHQPQTSQAVWRPALPPGQCAAYDEALEYIKHDSQAKKAQMRRLQQDKKVDKQMLERLEVASEINDPATRWQFKTGKADYTKAVFRGLYDSKWRKEGSLAVLVDHLKRSFVFPDVLPEFSLTADLVVRLPGSDEPRRIIKADALLEPAQTVSSPEIEIRINSSQERLYTLMLLDPDIADEVTEQYSTYCHFLGTNLPVSPSKDRIQLDAAIDPLLPYVPPHPQQGTKIHRYVLVLLEQPENGSRTLDTHRMEREHFNLRRFITKHNLTPIGVTYFRERWSPIVSDIYRNILKQEEPVYARRAGKLEYNEGRKRAARGHKLVQREIVKFYNYRADALDGRQHVQESVRQGSEGQ